jgi:hypothetical protein
MTQWADYLISEVRYGTNHLIEQVKIHTEDENGISAGTLIDRSQISHNIKNGKTYKTIFHGLKGWKLGDTVRVHRIDGDSFIRIDKNKTEQDFLGPILQIKP